jgi:NADH-quinone oxidoreductase subunit B
MFGLACYAMEMIATATPRYDIARFGTEIFHARGRFGRMECHLRR